MDTKNIFSTKGSSKKSPKTNTTNNAGGRAYSMSAKHALAQYAATGFFGTTFYVDAKEQLSRVLELSQGVEDEFLAKLAVYSRKEALLKDMPALLLAVLSTRNSALFRKVFPIVIDNGKMLRNFVQIMRSGVTGRKSLGSAPKKAIKQWLLERSDKQIFDDSVGNTPSMKDIILMVHPNPQSKERANLFKYLLDGTFSNRMKIAQEVKDFEKFKTDKKGKRKVPNVSFQMLTSQDLSPDEWKEIARNAKWTMTRMNLNTFKRHGVFEDKEMVDIISKRLADPNEIRFAKVFPYQVFTAYSNATDIPQKVRNSLHDAIEHAVKNIPNFDGNIFIGVDCSGSMNSPVTGQRDVASKITCNQAASVLACALLKRNEGETEVYRFDTVCERVNLDARDSILTNATRLNRNGGGTDVSCFLKTLNQQNKKGDLVIIISDMESWADRASYWSVGTSTETNKAWNEFQKRNPRAKLVCIDLQANESSQISDRKDCLNVGGFSDVVFDVISSFLESNGKEDFWAKKIEKEISLDL